jgi:hypothetical protein
MTFRRRSDRVKRLTIQGWKAHEAVQLLISSVVFDLRDAVQSGTLGEAAEPVALFQRDVRLLYDALLSIDPVIEPAVLRGRLEALIAACTGPVAAYRPRLERALAKLETMPDRA